MPKRYKKKRLLVFVAICLVVAGFYGIKILNHNSDRDKLETTLEAIENLNAVTETEDSENTEIIEPAAELDAKNPYYDYIEMKMLSVDFAELKTINPNVKGWVNVLGTNINYPFVRATDNEYYLTHSFDGSYNQSGWVFMDYRNGDENKHTILYAHARYEGTMFGSLKNILTDGWLNNPNNFIIRTSTATENSLWQIFSAYHLPDTSDYLKIAFASDADFLDFTEMLKNRSVYDFHTTIAPSDKILTLSTCYNDDERLAVHAKLIKREAR